MNHHEDLIARLRGAYSTIFERSLARRAADAIEELQSALTAAQAEAAKLKRERDQWREDWKISNAALADTQDKLQAAQALAERNRWIPVTERLPTEEGWYVVAISDPEDIGWDTDRWWQARWDGHYWCDVDPIEDGQPVTHWMHITMPDAALQAGDEKGRKA